jgi:hypothetical protein
MWYKDLVVAGAVEASLPQSYIDRLRLVPSGPDPKQERAERARVYLASEQLNGSTVEAVPTPEARLKTGQTVLDQIFNERLAGREEFDQEVVALVRAHVGGPVMHSRAGQRLGDALIQLARVRGQSES